jgi:zinc transport system ATP-binding protein
MNVVAGRRYIGYVPQSVEFDRDFPISVWEVVLLGRLGKRRFLRPYTAKDERIAAEALSNVEMFHMRYRPISELSGGQKKRVYIARALATEPKILLLDEPMASLDPHASTHISEILKQLNEHITILMISHDVAAIASCVKTVGCLNRKLFYHGEKQITPQMLELAYKCPVDLIAHGVPHRVFPKHLSEEIER